LAAVWLAQLVPGNHRCRSDKQQAP
jgi:hypothetical protein